MIRYRVIQNVEGSFGCKWNKVHTLESDEPISTKEIAKRLGIDDIYSIIDIKII